MTKTEIICVHYKMQFTQSIYPPNFIVFNELPSGVHPTKDYYGIDLNTVEEL